MFPGLGGINPKKMQAMLKQLGMSQEEIEAETVVIKKTDGSSITISNPSVQKIKMQGQETFQISGDISEQEQQKFTEEDVSLVAEKTSSTKEKARAALEKTNGDIAEAIVKLS